MIIRRETPADIDAVHAVTEAAFRPRAEPGRDETIEVGLLRALRGDDGWIPALSLVAVDDEGEIVGHVLCTRATVGDTPVLGLGPLSVRPDRQRGGVGKALVHTVLGAADAMGEPLVALLGDPNYYGRFGFQLSDTHGVTPPVPEWQPHFQVRTLHAHDPSVRGLFAYAGPFNEL
ncbi:N-acetyltransferase [Solihabitans fulvus]|uniref:N-acetyltransferase n=1 Tax=Solihabitans fulvus TaxID=1892852 RepID=A0A5B2XR05_9PSEU|nr:N-acetyltransferase [Solihabitans fulvus]